MPSKKGIQQIIEYLYHKHTLPAHAFVFLGTGDPIFETKLHAAASQKAEVQIITRFDEELAHDLYAASDLILIPSNFEPCGLIQLIAMKYGTIPIAHKTGGLIDTIIDNETGFLYSPNQTQTMISRLIQALNLVGTGQHDTMINKAMNQDFSWDRSADLYINLYRRLIRSH